MTGCKVTACSVANMQDMHGFVLVFDLIEDSVDMIAVAKVKAAYRAPGFGLFAR